MFADSFLGTLLAMVVMMLLMGRAHELTRGPGMALGWLFAPRRRRGGHGGRGGARSGCRCAHCRKLQGGLTSGSGLAASGSGGRRRWGRQLRLRRPWSPSASVKVAPPSVRPVTLAPATPEPEPEPEPAPLPATAVAEFKWH